MIHLPSPCPKNWNDMIPVDGGRHCNSCDKVIPDFTASSEEEIIHHLETTGQSCGHFRGDQVTDGSTYGGWQHYFNWKRAVTVLLMGSVFLMSCHRRTSGFYAPPKRKFKLNLKDGIKKREVRAQFLIENPNQK